MPIVPAEKVHRISIIFNFHVLQREREFCGCYDKVTHGCLVCEEDYIVFNSDFTMSRCLAACVLSPWTFTRELSVLEKNIKYKIQFNLELSQIRSEKMFVLRKSEKKSPSRSPSRFNFRDFFTNLQ